MKESQGDGHPARLANVNPRPRRRSLSPPPATASPWKPSPVYWAGAAGDYLTSPVVDTTKLEGAWDFTLKWTPHNSLTAARLRTAFLFFDAIVDKQLGLKLELKQLPSPVVVVDSVNEKAHR